MCFFGNPMNNENEMSRRNADLKEAELKYHTLFEQSPDGILLLDAKGNILDFNTNAHEQLGYTREEFSKLRISDHDPLETQEMIESKIKEMMKWEKAEHEVKHRTKNGEVRDVQVITQKIVLSGQIFLHAIWRDISERKRVEDALRESEEKFRTLFELANDGLIILDMQGNIIDFNRIAHERLGYTREEMQRMNIAQVNEPSFNPMISERIKHLEEHGQLVAELAHLRKDGTSMPIEINARIIRLGQKDVIFSMVRDITERKRAEQALRESEERFRLIHDQSPLGIGFLDVSGHIVECNDALTRIIGTPREKLIGFNLKDGLTNASMASALAKAYSGSTGIFEGDYTTVSSGRNITVREVFSPLLMEDGRLRGILFTIDDITERKQAEEMLRASQSRYKAIVDNQAEFVVRYIRGGILTFVNDTLCRYFNLERSDLIGKSYYSFIHEEDRPTAISQVEKLDVNKPSTVIESRIMHADGRIPWHQWTHSAIFDKEGNIIEYQATGRDITDSRAVEGALRQSLYLIRNILDSVDEGFIVVDRDYRIITANRAYCNQIGLPASEVVGKPYPEKSERIGIPCREEDGECAVRRVFETGMPYSAYRQYNDINGNTIYMETKAFPLKDTSGVVTSVVESTNNITEKHELEDERLKTQKLEAIGTLAGGIAHDFNNLLQGVFGYISLAKMTADRKEKSVAALEQAEKALHMTVKLTSQLLTFSKGGKPVKRLMDLLPVIADAAKFALSGSRSDYRISADQDLWQVEADDGQIAQVIQNIVLNADQAMPEGGRVEISVKNIQNSNGDFPPSLQKGKYLQIAIKDGGIGISHQYIAKIFDPYFTTKEKGSGLGLATSYSIIKNHSGLIDVKSEVAKGSIFTIYLPAIAGEDKPAVSQSTATAAQVRPCKVLLMDDEQVIRDVGGAVIKELGHAVEFAVNGEDAVEKYRAALESGKPFDIVILDLTIRGGMGGAEALQKLLKIDPGVKAVVSSGYFDDEHLSKQQEQGFKAFLKKPYKVEDLRGILNWLLYS
jgi:two-component system cell cycle sensor histidine kinase/response regulator CckA